jgi:hypothetical protein
MHLYALCRSSDIASEWTTYEDIASNSSPIVASRSCRTDRVENTASKLVHWCVSSTVVLRVVGGDKKGSLESETVKYERELHGIRTQE